MEDLKMISKIDKNDNANLQQFACLSTDTKPTELIANGSMCIEIDTGDIYMFDAAGAEWNKING